MIFYESIPNSPGWSLGVAIPIGQLMEQVNHILRYYSNGFGHYSLSFSGFCFDF